MRMVHTNNYSDVIIGVMASQITGVSIVYSTVCSGTDNRKHQSSAARAFARVIHRRPANSPRKGPVTRKMFQFDDAIMYSQNILVHSLTNCFLTLPTTSMLGSVISLSMISPLACHQSVAKALLN